MTTELQNAVFDAVNDVLNDYQQTTTLANLPSAKLNQLLTTFDESGFYNLLLDEKQGGAGLNLKQCLDIFLLEGRYALPVAFSSTNFARAWLYQQGFEMPKGVIAIEGLRTGATYEKNNIIVELGLKSEHFIETSGYVLLASDAQVFLVEINQFVIREIKGDSDYRWLSIDLSESQALAVEQEALQNLHDLAMLSLIARTVGAMRQSLEMTVQYATERVQFGRQLSKFQAIQQQLSVMAECVSSSRMAAELAFNSLTLQPKREYILLAKHEISMVANQVANIAHAVHGAIGITKEFPLHFYTKIIRQQRFLGGSEQFYAEQLGAKVLKSDKTLFSILIEDLLPS